MTLTKRIISFICVAAMVFSMCAVAVFAADPLTCDETVAANWLPLAAKYSKSTNGLIAPKNDGYAIRTTGFDYKADENGGIKVHTATYKENAGVYSVAAVSSKYKTALDGLSVELKPDDLTMMCDSNNASTNISFVITENPVTRLAGFDEASSSYTTGLYNSVDVMSNGMRELTFEEGKSLVVTISNQQISNVEDHIATAVAIVYDDGSYVNKNDGHNGFRWVFSARNYAAESSNGDHSGIVQTYEKIDFSKGLKLEIRADEKLGYIVSVNGKDYYDATYIGYYPDCSQDTFEGKEYNSYALKDDDYDNLTKNYLNSMTYAAKNINLSGLGEGFEGYLTVGATGTNVTVNNCDFTVTKINTHNAATWAGEVACQHTETNTEVTKAPTCGKDGKEETKCVECGKVISTVTLPATGDHTEADEYVVTKAATCVAEGEKTLNCTVCNKVIKTETIAVDVDAHSKTMKEITAADCENTGTQQEVCTLCEAVFGDVIDIPALGHDDGEWVVVVESGCTVDGVSERQCTRCGYIHEQRNDGMLGHDYDNGEWTVVTPATYFEEGEEVQSCTRCDEEIIDRRVIAVLEYVNKFDDVKDSHWFASQVAYVVKRAYMSGMSDTKFQPMGNIKREQFVLILANMSGVNTDDYKNVQTAFTDVKTGQWYSGAVAWAVENGYVSGMTETSFGRGKDITRAQLARLFYVYAEKALELDVTGAADISGFADASIVNHKNNTWMKAPVEWAVNAGIINGMSVNGKLSINPNGTATRAQAAVMLMAFDDFRGLNSTEAE